MLCIRLNYGSCVYQGQLWDNFSWIPKSGPLAASIMEISITPFWWAKVNLSERCWGLEGQDFCCRVKLRHPDYLFPGFEKGITCLSGLSGQQRMARALGWRQLVVAIWLGSGWGSKIAFPLKRLQRQMSPLGSLGLPGEGREWPSHCGGWISLIPSCLTVLACAPMAAVALLLLTLLWKCENALARRF